MSVDSGCLCRRLGPLRELGGSRRRPLAHPKGEWSDPHREVGFGFGSCRACWRGEAARAGAMSDPREYSFNARRGFRKQGVSSKGRALDMDIFRPRINQWKFSVRRLSDALRNIHGHSMAPPWVAAESPQISHGVFMGRPCDLPRSKLEAFLCIVPMSCICL